MARHNVPAEYRELFHAARHVMNVGTTMGDVGTRLQRAIEAVQRLSEESTAGMPATPTHWDTHP